MAWIFNGLLNFILRSYLCLFFVEVFCDNAKKNEIAGYKSAA